MLLLIHPNISNAAYSLDNIEPRLHQFIEQSFTGLAEDIEVKVSAIDQRLLTKTCPEPLTIDWMQTHQRQADLIGRRSLKVACQNAKQAWKIYVPIAIYQYLNIAIAKIDIAKGETLTQHNLAAKRTLVKRQHHRYVNYSAHLLGQVTKRAVSQQRPLLKNSLQPADIIQKGQAVDIIVSNQNITIRAMGIAQHDAAIGERLQVKNQSSQNIVEAFVVDKHTVKVNL